MATIKPFRAIRYNQEKIDHINHVISQPYDRVRSGLQDEYSNLSEFSQLLLYDTHSFLMFQ